MVKRREFRAVARGIQWAGSAIWLEFIWQYTFLKGKGLCLRCWISCWITDTLRKHEFSMNAAPRVVRFSDFEVNLLSGELRRSGLRVKLADQSFYVLAMLLAKPGEVVAREELRKKLWAEDTFVDFDGGLNSAIKRLRDALSDSADAPQFIETLPRRGYRFIHAVEQASGEDLRHIDSLAVLPLENLTGDSSQEYFADGMTDALITRLAQIGSLRVISRTSAMAYKGKKKTLPQIALELDVEAVVEGTVARSGNRVRITAQLIRAASDRHLWAMQYERDLTDVLVLQAEVASAIANEVQVRLTPFERARLASARLVDPEAYDAYLRGRLHWNKRNEDGMKKGLELFEKSLSRDPSYALSYAGVAESYNMMAYWGVAAPHELSPKARGSAYKALEIDGNLAEAHAALGWTLFAYDWNWSEAEKEFRRAIELNPGYAIAHQWYSHLLICKGRTDEAFSEVRRTLELDPVSLIMNSNAAHIYILGHHWEEAARSARRAIDIENHFAPPHLFLGRVYEEQGRFREALSEFRKGVAISGENARYLSGLAHGLALAGRASGARRVLAKLLEMSRSLYVSAYDFAVIHAGLGQKDEAFACLEESFKERATWLVKVKGDARFDSFRSDPRLQNLTARLGLGS